MCVPITVTCRVRMSCDKCCLDGSGESPNSTVRPKSRVSGNAVGNTFQLPVTSYTTSARLPSVCSETKSRASAAVPLKVPVAPHCAAIANLWGTVSTASMARSPIIRRYCVTNCPKGPRPMTTAVSPIVCSARRTAVCVINAKVDQEATSSVIPSGNRITPSGRTNQYSACTPPV